jgi:hypothetical protein
LSRADASEEAVMQLAVGHSAAAGEKRKVIQ